MIEERSIQVENREVLELGCGTGLASLVCCKRGARRVVMTDYNDAVLENLRLNVANNGCLEASDVFKLDWEKGEQAAELLGTLFEVIIAADVVYDFGGLF